MQHRLWFKPVVVIFLVMIVIGSTVTTPSAAQPSEPTAVPVLKQIWRDGIGILGQMVWSADGSIIAAPAVNGIWLFSADKFEDEPLFIPVPSLNIDSTIRISQDSRYVIVWGPYLSTAYLIEVAGQSIRQLSVTELIVDAMFVPNSNRFIVGSADSYAKRVVLTWWDVKTLDQTAKITRSANGLRELFLTPDGKQIASAYEITPDQADRLPEVFDSETGVKLNQKALRVPASQRIWRFVPDLKRVIAFPSKGETTLATYDLLTGKRIVALEALTVDVVNAATQFRINQSRLIIVQQNGFDVWDLESGRRLVSHIDDKLTIQMRSFNAEATKVVETSTDATLTLRAIYPTAQILSQRDDLGVISNALALSPTQALVARLNRQAVVQITDAVTGKRALRWQMYDRDCANCYFGMIFTPDGKQLITIDPFAIKIWDPRTAALVRKIDQDPKAFDGATDSVSYSDLGWDQGAKTLYYRQFLSTVARLNDTFEAVDLATGKKVSLPREITFKPQWTTVRLSADGTRALVANAPTQGGSVLVWQPREAKLRGTYALGSGTESACALGFSGNDPYGVFAGKNKVMFIRTVQSADQIISKSIKLTNEDPTCVDAQLLREGKYLIIRLGYFAIEDQTYHFAVQLWDLQTRRQIASTPLSVDPVSSVLTADGKTMITANTDGTLRAWALP